MARKKSDSLPALPFVDTAFRRKHSTLFLRTYLAEAAQKATFSPDEINRISTALSNWAEHFKAGRLARKETELDAELMQNIFGVGLDYKTVIESPADFHRQKHPTIVGNKIPDAVVGRFISGKEIAPTAVIELKGADVDLDIDKDSSGRTAVQQCWDYLNHMPDTPWGIVSNYKTIRLYHKSRPMTAYEEFTIQDFVDPVRVREFYFVFCRINLLGTKATANASATENLLRRTANRQREIGDDLYGKYADYRDALIRNLMTTVAFTQDQAIHTAQLLLDRIVFMAFCEERGLLRENLIANTWKNVAPLTRVVNPRWQNFLDTFYGIDSGHANLDLPTGYNGGLFKHDDLVDNLQLEDRWTDVFRDIGEYDFRPGGEVSVEVLGHIFERSINELEKLRAAGLFGDPVAEKAVAAMPKSAERKRSGTYYTPPQFTELIVERTLGELITARVEPVADLVARVAELRKIKVVDPACGSGAFLIAAYDRLERSYAEIARLMRLAGHVQEALNLENAFPDFVLADNLHGVDLSEQAVEITKLALWIRSVRKGRSLADLEGNIYWGNSLVRDPDVHEKAFDWQARFPKVFAAGGPATGGSATGGSATGGSATGGSATAESATGGFDVVIGNPPWERLKVQEREFFSLAAPEIASTANAADRRRLVASLEARDPALWTRYKKALSDADAILAYVRTEAADFPLTGRGDVNTYMLFAELARKIGSPTGYVGLLLPSGIATDSTTKEFFGTLVESKTLVALYDFVNRLGRFPDIEGRFKFCVLLTTGKDRPHEQADFVFFAEEMAELADRKRHIKLTASDLKLLNPNTLTCPVFRSRTDAEITKRIYRATPILYDRRRKLGGNPWAIRFTTMFHATNDAELFITPKLLLERGYTLDGNRWKKGGETYLPLLEAKMTRDYDHRATRVRLATGNWYMNYEAESASLVDHQNPEFLPYGRWWVAEDAVKANADDSQTIAAISFHDIARSTDSRTMVACAIPFAAVANTLPLIVNASGLPWRRFLCLLGNLNSLAYDYVVRQKIGGAHLNFFIVEQLPTLPPDTYDDPCPWDKSLTLEDWIADRVLKLTCTADDMRPLAAAAGFAEGVHKWKDDERARLRAELDAAYFHLYRLDREDVEYILGTFQGIRDEDIAAEGAGWTRSTVVADFNRFAESQS